MALKDTLNDVVSAAKSLLPHENEDEHEDKDEHEDEATEAVEPPAVDALEILKEDHRRVEALFKEILSEKFNALTSQRKQIAKVIAELELHAKVEETLFYPAVYGKTKRDTEERLEVLEAVEEHGSMKDLIRKIKKTAGRDEKLKAKVQVLSEITEHHVKEEESEFFPEAKKLLGDDKLHEIGQQILKLKARAERRRPVKRSRTTVAGKVTARKKKRSA